MTGLLGPNGRPISSSEFKKAKDQPILGEAFGVWGPNADIRYANLPGIGIVQFDLSKLTLADYKVMRDHYQVNASLNVLSFMQHQSDWHIECENQKIADECERQLRNIWTQLNRAMSVANWSGYSPNILQWENNDITSRTELSKVKDLDPASCAVNWKEIDGWVPPGSNAKNKLKVYDGIKQIGAPWPIPSDNCVTPDTLILCDDFKWRPAGELKLGQGIVAFDENESNYGRSYKLATIVVNNPGNKECVTVLHSRGSITMTTDHPVLVRSYPVKRVTRKAVEFDGKSCPNCKGAVIQNGFGPYKKFCSSKCQSEYAKSQDKLDGVNYKEHWVWRNAGDLEVGDRIAYFGDPWSSEDNWISGYLAGVFDGEASISATGQLAFWQKSGRVLDLVLDLLDSFDFEYELLDNRGCTQVTIHGGIRESMRFVGIFDTQRIKVPEVNTRIKIGKSVDLVEVQRVENVGNQDIASIQTSAGTFITGGLLSHNSFWYPMLMENNDYMGRKLLRPAFTSWFFSILIHMFANRYFERYGEPVVKGRAPFENDVQLPDGTKLNGLEYMISVMKDLRNRAVIALPDDKTEMSNGRMEFDYDISYLESQMRGADWERYLTRLDEEISIGLFTPILLLRTADVGSYNLGVGHMQMYLWMLNAMNDDRAQYINKYILSRMTDFNFSVKAPRPRIVFRKLGNQNADVLVQVMKYLTQGGRISFDYKELGEIVGMTVTEVKQTIEDASGDSNNSDDPSNEEDNSSVSDGADE